jgi:SSS family solute:Na+ symporter
LWSIALLVGIYTVKGGLSSIMWTDALQCLMLVGGGLVLFFVALKQIPGGWAAMEAANPERFHLYRPPDDPLTPFAGILCGVFGVALFYQSTNQVMVQRVLAARSTWDGIMGIVFAGFINLLRPLVTCFLGFVVYHWIHEMGRAEPIQNLDYAFPFALRYFAPGWGLRGIVLAGFLAAVMSTVSALANATATIFSLDVYQRFIRPRADERRTVLVGRCAAAVSLVLASLLAPFVAQLGGIFRFFQTGVTYTATPFISVILLGLIWKRTSYAGALFGLIGGLFLVVTLAVGLPFAGQHWHWLYVAFLAQVLTMIGVVLVSLKTTAPSREQWEPFYWHSSLLSQYSVDSKRPWYKKLKLWYGLLTAIWLFVYWRFW